MIKKDSMRVGVIEGIRKVAIRELPIPEPGPGEILINTQACALCTWEQRIYSGVDKKTPPPFAGGHEFAGVVAAIGEGTKTDLKLGDLIAPGPRAGGPHDFDFYRMKYLDLFGPMGLAEYKVVTADSVYRLANDLPVELGCFTEPLACVIHAADKINYSLAQDVVVIGAGPMGILNMMIAKCFGTRVIVSELDKKRNKFARDMGADDTINPSEEDAAEKVLELTGGKGADVVVVAIGSHAANLDALKMVAKFGTVMLFASAHPPTDLMIDPDFIHRKQVTLTGAQNPSASSFKVAADMVSKGLLNLSPLIEHKYPMDQIEEAFERAIEPDSYRVIISME